MLYRHGDVLIAPVDEIPETRRKLQHTILAHGEVTGHSHRIQDHKTADLFESVVAAGGPAYDSDRDR